MRSRSEIVLLLLCAVGVFLFLGRAGYRAYEESDRRIVELRTFNDCSAFVPSEEDSRVFRYIPGKDEAYLLFYLPGFDPSGFVLNLKIRAPAHILRRCRTKLTSGLVGSEGRVDGDTAEFTIDMANASDYMWAGNCYVGLVFDSAVLHPGDKIELLSFRFDRRCL